MSSDEATIPLNDREEGDNYLLTEGSPRKGDTSVISENDDEKEEEPQGKASIMSSIVNLTNTVLGAGMLGLSLSIRESGIILGGILLVLSGCAAIFGLYILNMAASKVQKGEASYFSVAELTYPKAAVVIDIAVAIKCFGVAISYLVVAGDLLPDVVLTLTDQTHSVFTTRQFWVSIVVGVLFPICLLRRMNSLRFTSFTALSTVVYILTMVFIYFVSLDGISVNRINYAPQGTSFFASLPVFVFSYTCHQNLFSIYNEQKGTSKDVHRVIIISIFISFGVYACIGYFGYFTFLDAVDSNLINNYSKTEIPVLIARICVSILVAFSYPLQIYPCRASITNVLIFLTSFIKKWNINFNEKLKERIPQSAITLVLCLMTFVIAYHLDDLGIVFSVIGATGSVTICYILPGIFYYKIVENEGWRWNIKKIAAVAMVIIGIFIMVNSLVFIFLKAIN